MKKLAVFVKELAVALSALVVGTMTASAADLAPRYAKAPPPPIAAVYNWTGFYVGINGGGGSAHTCWDLVGFVGLPVTPPEDQGCHNATGGTVGGQIGYRWQSVNWVFGVEAQGNWADFKGSNANPLAALANSNDVTKIDGFGLFTGQVGYAWNNVLLYVKGGAALVSDKNSITLISANSPTTFAGQVFASGSETRWGGSAGVGLEFGFAPNWSVGVEYNHLFMGTRDVQTNLVPPFGTTIWTTNRIGQDVDVGTVRVNYHFGGSVVAKY